MLLLHVAVPSCFLGLILENCELPYSNHGHVILGDPSPILFYPVSTNEIHCFVDVPGQKIPSIANGEMSQYLKTVVAPQSELRAAFICAVDKGSIRTMTNRSMPASPSPTSVALLLGDAFNVQHPLTRGGMIVTL
ncbi:squalene epoxidase 1-like [Hevea brasiliensis]|uniref:squalene epoxidase 1-like n=1 Tax=Hevea brasiliensis TaxID=3981 RepID=UPI0025CC225A|nr:squalene epoxidase 1-like [Hevea brasiliensis]